MKTAWHEPLCALFQNCTDLNGMPNAANRIFGSTDGNFDRSAGPVDRISEGTYSQHTIYMPYTSHFGPCCSIWRRTCGILITG